MVQKRVVGIEFRIYNVDASPDLLSTHLVMAPGCGTTVNTRIGLQLR